MNTSAFRDGTLKKPTKLDGNDTIYAYSSSTPVTSTTVSSTPVSSTVISHHPYILCHFATAYTNMLCVFLSCVQRVVVGSAGSAVVWDMEWG